MEKIMTPKKTHNCGHPVKAIVIGTSEESLSTYFNWKNSGSGLCLECWLKNRNIS